MADEKPYNISIETKAQLAELQKLLTELRAINAEIAKMNGLTFSSINASVSELAKAGKELSSALVSLPKTMDTIADDVKKIGEESKKAGEDLNGLKTTAQGVFMELGAQITDFAVNKLKQIPAAIMSSIEAFGQQEMAVQKLAAAIRSQGGSVSEVLPIMSAFASEMQRITTYGDEQVLAMQAMATSMGVNSDQMQGVIKSAIGLASALNMDVMTAIKAASAAVQGKTTMLQEYIPALAKCKTEEEKLATVQKLSASGFAQAKAEAETTAGKLKQAANAWGDLAEVAGGTFAPVAVDVANALKLVCEWFSKNQEFTQLLIGSLSSLAVGFAFSRIGGLASVAALFKTVSAAIVGTKAASDALNVSLKANPLGIAMTAVSAFALLVSHLHSKEKARYESNIEQSKEYRDGIDAEIDAMKQWGISAEDNEKRTAEVADEIAKLKAEEEEYRKSHGQLRGAYGGAMYKVYSKEEQAEIDNYRAKIEKLEERQKAAANVKELDALAAKRHAAAVAASEEILAKSAEEMRAAQSATEALKVTRERYARTEKEIAELQKAFDGGKIADSERVAKAERLRRARLELLELGKKEIEQETALAASKYAALKTAELNKQNDLEARLAGARLRGNAAEAKSLETELEGVKIQRKRLDIITAYISARKSEIKTAEDLNRIQADAARYANATLEFEKQKADSEKWLNGEIERNKAAQRDMELEILRARASGNEAGARELEQKLRISQIASEIFESTRKEGMSRDELERLQASANEKAREKCELEKSITDEIERQNLAKDAQAKIEDILLTNKIEQLKSEGKLTEARELERERENRRTIAGIPGLSADDKEKLLSTMRQTNDYRDKQEKMRGGGGGSGYGAGTSSYSGGGGYAGSSGGSYGSSGYGGSYAGGFGGGYGGAAKYSGPTPPRRPRPATISEKYRGLYEEWQASGGSRSGVSWIDYRNSRRGEVDAAEKARKSYGKTVVTDANTPVAEQRDRAAKTISGIESEAKGMASRVTLGGAVGAAANSVPNEAPRKAPRAGGEEESESPENRQRRTQIQTKSQPARPQTAQLSNPTLEILREILMNVKSLRESD